MYVCIPYSALFSVYVHPLTIAVPFTSYRYTAPPESAEFEAKEVPKREREESEEEVRERAPPLATAEFLVKFEYMSVKDDMPTT